MGILDGVQSPDVYMESSSGITSKMRVSPGKATCDGDLDQFPVHVLGRPTGT
jgi:hypothetical protein